MSCHQIHYSFFIFKQKMAYDITRLLYFRRVLLRSHILVLRPVRGCLQRRDLGIGSGVLHHDLGTGSIGGFAERIADIARDEDEQEQQEHHPLALEHRVERLPYQIE